MDDFLNDDKFDIIIFYVFNARIIILFFKKLFIKNNLFLKFYFNFLTIFFVVYIFWGIYTFFFSQQELSS